MRARHTAVAAPFCLSYSLIESLRGRDAEQLAGFDQSLRICGAERLPCAVAWFDPHIKVDGTRGFPNAFLHFPFVDVVHERKEAPAVRRVDPSQRHPEVDQPFTVGMVHDDQNVGMCAIWIDSLKLFCGLRDMTRQVEDGGVLANFGANLVRRKIVWKIEEI